MKKQYFCCSITYTTPVSLECLKILQRVLLHMLWKVHAKEIQHRSGCMLFGLPGIDVSSQQNMYKTCQQ